MFIHTAAYLVMDSSADGAAPSSGGEEKTFSQRLFEFRATYHPDEPRMSRWRWWVVFVFLPPVALLIVWKDKKFFKQMALVIFYIFTIYLVWIFVLIIIGSGIVRWEILLLEPLMVAGSGMLFGILLAAYAQHKIIKTEERIRDGADP